MTVAPSSLPIGARLGVAFGGLLALLLAVVAVGLLQLHAIGDLGAQRTLLAGQAQAAERWRGAVTLNLTRALGIAASGYHPATVAFLEPPMTETSAMISRLQDGIAQGLTDPAVKSLFAQVGARRKAYVDVRAKAAAAFKAGRVEEGDRIVHSEMKGAAQAYLDSIDVLQTHAQARAAALQVDVEQRTRRAEILVLVLALVAVLAGAGMAWCITRSITRPLRTAIGTAWRIAGHDLSVPVAGGGADELGALHEAFGQMQASLVDIVRHIQDGTVGLAGASGRIAASSSDLSLRTEQTSGSLQQAAATMDQISAAVNQTAAAAGTARELAAEASDVARRGGAVVNEVVATMNDIDASSRRIGEIIGTIDGIAFQTNLLALNAAVEAARAGEQGRGFAVVAGEVRLLAQRSAAAAGQIRHLVTTSVDRVQAGSRLVADAGSTMTEIVASVARVGEVIAEVTTAAGEQSRGMGRLHGSVATLEHMTRQNAGLVEESAAAAASLNEQAGQLAALVSSFRLDAPSAQSA